jgi:hypothetical protein
MDLFAVTGHYRARFRLEAQAELESFRQESSLAEAVRRAALATTPDGRRYRHQSRLKRKDLERASGVLAARLAEIAEAADFAKLYALCESALRPLDGLGELYLYDTALRISARKGALPRRIYLHAGTRAGAKALRLDTRGKAIDLSDLPPALRELEAHEIEDVLCIYKKYFTGERPVLDDESACWIDSDKDEE